jgi:uncharacterized protein (DUF488 family)
MTSTIYTVGHSTHSIEKFTALLRQFNITALCDVRSRPYSRMNPQFNREPLKEALKDASIKYVFLGRELGARSEARMILRWTGTAMLEADKSFRRLKAHKQLPILKAALLRHQQPLLGVKLIASKNLAS